MPEVAEPPVTDTTDTDPPRANDRRAIDDVVDELVQKYGSERAALSVLADKNLDHRRERAELRKLVPKDGERVLSKDEAKAFDEFQALGKKPKEIAAALTEADQLRTENTSLKEERVTDEAAGLLEYKPTVLRELAKLKGFRVEVKEEKDDKGEAARIAYAVTGDGDKVTTTPLAEFATTALSDFLPSLTAVPPNGSGKSSTAPATPVPSQPPRGTAPANKVKDVAAIAADKRATGAYSQL